MTTTTDAANQTVRAYPADRGRSVRIGTDDVSVILEPPGGAIIGGPAIKAVVEQARAAVAAVVAQAVSEDRARRRWSWLPGYRRLAWGENIMALGTLYRNGRRSKLAATELVTVLGFGYCRHDLGGFDPVVWRWMPLGGTGTAWGFFSFVPGVP